MRNRKNLYLLVILLLLSNVFIHAYKRYEINKAKEIRAVREKLRTVSKSLRFVLPKNFHLKNHDKRELDKGENKRVIKKLTDYAVENDLRFVYSFVRWGGNVHFTSSSLGKNESLDNPEVKYGLHFAEASPLVHSAFEQDGFYEEITKDRWGSFYAVYYSRRYMGTNVRWVGGAEVSTKQLDTAVQKALLKTILETIFSFTGWLPVILLLIFFNAQDSSRHKSELQSSINLTKTIEGMYRRMKKENEKLKREREEE